MKGNSRISTLWAALAGLYFLLWLPVRADQIWLKQLDGSIYCWISLAVLPFGLLWLLWAAWAVRRPSVSVCFFLSVVYVVWWQLAVAATDAMAWDVLREPGPLRDGGPVSDRVGLGRLVCRSGGQADRVGTSDPPSRTPD